MAVAPNNNNITQITVCQKIDSREKIRSIKNYLTELKSNPELMPLFTINVEESGFIDYDYITRRRHTFTDIQKKLLKENNYDNIKQVCEDLKHLVHNISDYLLLNDPLQEICSRAIRMIHEFQNKFAEEFRENKPVKVQPKVSKKQEKKEKQKEKEKQKDKISEGVSQFNHKSTFKDKIQMFYYLKAH